MKLVDPILNPFEVHIEGPNYNVMESIGRKDSKGNNIFKSHGHFTSMGYALKKIHSLKVETEEQITLVEYITKSEQIKNELLA